MDILDMESIEIRKEDVTFFMGQSGLGKSTFLKLMNKLISTAKVKSFTWEKMSRI